MSGGGNRSSGPGKGSGSTSTPVPANAPSWAGGTNPNDFDAKKQGTTLFSDLMKVYGQGPKVFGESLSTPYSEATSGLIDQGLGDVQSQRNGVVGEVAGGGWLDGGNPYFEQALGRTRENVSTDLNSTFNASGLFGSDLHAKGLAEGMGNVENDARMANFENEYNRMMGAQGAMQQGTATGLGYGNMLDSKAQEQQLANYDLFNRQNNAGFEHVAKNLGVLTGGQGGAQENTNQPVTIWDILGGAASGIGGILGSIF